MLRTKNRGKNLGSAHIPIALQFLATLPDTIDFKESKDLMGALKLFWDEVVLKVPKAELPFHIQVFRLSKPKKANAAIIGGGYARMTLRFARPRTFPDTGLQARGRADLCMQRAGLGCEVRHSTEVLEREEGPGHLCKVINCDGAGSELVTPTDEAVDGASNFESNLGFDGLESGLKQQCVRPHGP